MGVDDFSQLCFVPNSHKLLVSSKNTLYFTDYYRSGIIKSLTSHKDYIQKLAVANTGKLAATVGADGYLILWNLDSLTVQTVLTTANNMSGGTFTGLSFSADNHFLALTYDKKVGNDFISYLTILNLNTNEFKPEVRVEENITTSRFSNDSSILLLGLESGYIIKYDILSGSQLDRLKIDNQIICRLSMLKNGQLGVYTDNTSRIDCKKNGKLFLVDFNKKTRDLFWTSKALCMAPGLIESIDDYEVVKNYFRTDSSLLVFDTDCDQGPSQLPFPFSFTYNPDKKLLANIGYRSVWVHTLSGNLNNKIDDHLLPVSDIYPIGDFILEKPAKQNIFDYEEDYPYKVWNLNNPSLMGNVPIFKADYLNISTTPGESAVCYSNFNEWGKKTKFNRFDTSCISGIYLWDPVEPAQNHLLIAGQYLPPFSLNNEKSKIAQGGLFSASVRLVGQNKNRYDLSISNGNEVLSCIWPAGVNTPTDLYTIERSEKSELELYSNQLAPAARHKILSLSGCKTCLPKVAVNEIRSLVAIYSSNNGNIDEASLTLIDLRQEKVTLKKSYTAIRDITFSGDTVIVLTSDSLHFILGTTGDVIRSAYIPGISRFKLTGKDDIGLALRYSGIIDVLSINRMQVVASLITDKDGGWMALLPDNYYYGSKYGIRSVGFRYGSELLPPDQLDVRYNRPDKVLSAVGTALGHADTTLINAFYKAWQKRVQKLGIDTAGFSGTLSIPECDFLNRPEIKYEQHDSIIQLTIHAIDSNAKLDCYNVWVNNVPLYGKSGIRINSQNLNDITKTVSIELSAGINKIESSVRTVNGIESYRQPLYVQYIPNRQLTAKLYFVGIGIDEFQETGHNLQYSVKDIYNLADSLKKQYGLNMITHVLANKEVTVNNILKLKEHLLQSNVEDKVILAYSGHGLLDKELDYYLSTYNVNFKNPEQGGLSYIDFEWLLDSIPARKKLMLIDACHSGELDKQEVIAINQAVDSLSQVGKGERGCVLTYTGTTKHLGLKNSFELMQELFANVNRGTGATVIAASGGTQFAQENGTLKNGVFTYSILELMNKSKQVTVSQLKNIVSTRVQQLTNGMQKPTSRAENIDNDWVVW